MAENKGQSCMYHALFHTQNLDKNIIWITAFAFADVAVQQPGAQSGAAQAQAEASHEPVTLVCPSCNTQVTTDVEYSMGTCSWIWVIALLLFCLCAHVPRPLRPALVSSMPLPLALVFRSWGSAWDTSTSILGPPWRLRCSIARSLEEFIDRSRTRCLCLVCRPLAFIPCVCSSCKNAKHKCPHCNSVIGVPHPSSVFSII